MSASAPASGNLRDDGTVTEAGKGAVCIAPADKNAQFKKLKAMKENQVCFDCPATRPTWASVTYGTVEVDTSKRSPDILPSRKRKCKRVVTLHCPHSLKYVPIPCSYMHTDVPQHFKHKQESFFAWIAQPHINMGIHTTFVRSVDLDESTQHPIDATRLSGNGNARQYFRKAGVMDMHMKIVTKYKSKWQGPMGMNC